MNTALETIWILGVVRLAAGADMTMGPIIFFACLATRLSRSQLVPLFDDLNPHDTARIVHLLNFMGIPNEVTSNKRQIRVPWYQLARLRLALAQQGRPQDGSIGYEVFDRDQTLGTSSFIQNINHVRALEGALSRTIISFTSARVAHVHLVLPRREVFSRQRQEASASVDLKMRGSEGLDRGQVQSVRHLVATAVPGLKPDCISIIDDRRTLLARGGDNDAENAAAMNAEEQRVAFESRLTKAIEQLLEPSLASGNVRTEIIAEMDFDRVLNNQEIFDPEEQVAHSTQTISEAYHDRNAANGVISVGQSLPNPPADNAEGSTQSNSNRTKEAVNFQISETIRSHTHKIGDIERLSVAVLVNDRVTTIADGAPVFQARTAEELANIERLAKSAVGFNESRGDTAQIVNKRSTEVPGMLGGVDDPLFLDFSTAELRRIVEVLILAVFGVLIILLVVRPLISKIFKITQGQLATPGTGMDKQPALQTNQSGIAGAIAGQGGAISAVGDGTGGGMLVSGKGSKWEVSTTFWVLRRASPPVPRKRQRASKRPSSSWSRRSCRRKER